VSTDEELRAAYEEAGARFQSTIENLAAEHAREEDQDW
jgi:hypothetical protein